MDGVGFFNMILHGVKFYFVTQILKTLTVNTNTGLMLLGQYFEVRTNRNNFFRNYRATKKNLIFKLNIIKISFLIQTKLCVVMPAHILDHSRTFVSIYNVFHKRNK